MFDKKGVLLFNLHRRRVRKSTGTAGRALHA
jgi:hypothetical protein